MFNRPKRNLYTPGFCLPSFLNQITNLFPDFFFFTEMAFGKEKAFRDKTKQHNSM